MLPRIGASIEANQPVRHRRLCLSSRIPTSRHRAARPCAPARRFIRIGPRAARALGIEWSLAPRTGGYARGVPPGNLVDRALTWLRGPAKHGAASRVRGARGGVTRRTALVDEAAPGHWEPGSFWVSRRCWQPCQALPCRVPTSLNPRSMPNHLLTGGPWLSSAIEVFSARSKVWSR